MRVDEILVATAAALAALGVILALVVKLARRVRMWARRGEAVAETLLGRDEIRHPETGAILVPATPGIGLRITTIEDTLNTLANTQATIADTELRMEHLAESFDGHLRQAADMAEDHRRLWAAIDDLRKHVKERNQA